MIKKIFLFILVLMISWSSKAQSTVSQKNVLSIGVDLDGFATANLQQLKSFGLEYALFVAPSWQHGDWAISPFYNIGENSAGLSLSYSFHKHLTVYGVVEEAFKNKLGNYALGINTLTLGNNIQGFVEIGKSYGEEISTSLLIGFSFSLSKNIISW